MNLSLSTASRSVYVLCKATNAVMYSIHRQAPKNLSWRPVIYNGLQYLQALKLSFAVIHRICTLSSFKRCKSGYRLSVRSKCYTLQYLQAR